MPKVHELALNESPQHTMNETEVQAVQEENGMFIQEKKSADPKGCSLQELFCRKDTFILRTSQTW